MTLELSIVISVLSVSFALYSGISNLKRNDKKDTAEETAQLTTVIVKLENIGDGVSEIKSDMKNVKGEVQELRERLVVVEQSAKSAHHRLDGLAGGVDA